MYISSLENVIKIIQALPLGNVTLIKQMLTKSYRWQQGVKIFTL